MDNSGLGGGLLSGPNGGMLGLESSLHRRQQSQLSLPSLTRQHHRNMMTGLENDHHPVAGNSLNFVKGKGISPVAGTDYNNFSEDEEPSFTEDGNGENMFGAKGKKGSPWQRMKWTDNVVRLLIAVVACVGDDGIVEGIEGHKRRSGILQKKGKWKTVSKIMIRKGCHVSPQQCEDKFNDLNKRYKRLNDILGRGTSCRVVENPALMDSMPHLSAKAKDDVRKILSSKHLFYKEMCAYHNGQVIPNCHDVDLQSFSLPPGRCSNDNNGSEEEEGEEHDEHDDDETDNEDDHSVDGDVERMGELGERKKSSDDGHFWSQSGVQDSFEVKIAGVFQDPTKSPWERREWIKKKILQLEEERASFEAQALELEKQRFKWLRYCSKKNRELEKLKLENERMKLHNEQRVLQLKHKELEIGLKRSEASLNPISIGVDRLQAKDQIDHGRYQ